MKVSLITIIIFLIIIGIALYLLTKKSGTIMGIESYKASLIHTPKLKIVKQDTQGLAA